MRRACFSSVAGRRQAPLASASVEQLLVRRRAPEEERQPRREIDVGDAVGAARLRVSSGSFSIRKMKYGLARIASSALRTPASNPPLCAVAAPFRRTASGDHLARRDRPAVGVAAEPREDLARAGTLFRRARRPAAEDLLRGSASPRCRCAVRPVMIRSRTCGSVVMPGPPDPPPANDQSCGRIRSSYGPSILRTNAAATWCWPALTRIGSVRIGTAPRPSAPPAGRSRTRCSATRSPSIEMSMSSSRALSPP